MNTTTHYSQMSQSRVLAAYLGDIRYEFIKMLRTPAFAVPTLLFPAMFYLLFGVLMGSARGNSQMSLYAFAAYGVFGTMAPGLFGFGVSLAFEREQGLLTFKQALPMPAGSYLLARMAMAMIFVSIIALLLIGMAVFIGHVPMTPGQAATVYLIDVLGVLPFCAIGLYVGSLVSGQAAPAIVNLIYLPMAFLSGLWVPMQFLPHVVQQFAPIWPPFHLAQLSLSALGAPSVGSTATHVGALAGVTVVFFWLAMRRLNNGGIRLFGRARGGGGVVLRRALTVGALWIAIGLVVAGYVNGNAKVELPAASADADGASDTAAAAPVGIAAPEAVSIADFDSGSATAAYGEGWVAGGDDMRGGNSKATQRVVDGGAQNSRAALEVSGTVGDALQYPFGGTAFFPNGFADGRFMNYSGKKTLSFFVRGDGRQYTVLFLAGLQVDAIPAMYPFTAGPEWQEIRVPLTMANLDAKRVHGIVIGSMGPPGDFGFLIDNVRIE